MFLRWERAKPIPGNLRNKLQFSELSLFVDVLPMYLAFVNKPTLSLRA
jgi:hypothetical protein